MLDPGSQCYLLFTHDHARTRIRQTMREHMLRHKSNGTIECKIVIGPPNMVTFIRNVFTPNKYL